MCHDLFLNCQIHYVLKAVPEHLHRNQSVKISRVERIMIF
jgi:hypothetical protein